MTNKKIILEKDLIIKKVKTEVEPFYCGLSYQALCVNRDFSIPIFIYNLLPNEEADIKITYYSKKCCFAEVVKYRKLSPLRLILNKNEEKLYITGSAPLMSLDYENQLKFKQFLIKSLFERNLKFANVSPIISSNCKQGYRNKISIHVDYQKNKPILGFYKKYSHELVEQFDIYLGVYAIREFYKNVLHSPTTEYNKQLNKAIFNLKPKQIVLRAPKTSLATIEIIIDTENKFNRKQIDKLEELNKQKPVFKFSIFQNKKWLNILDHKGIDYEMEKYIFSVQNDSFYQINEGITNLIYNQILDWIPLQNLIICDAFAGVATIGTYISSKAKKIYSIETNQNSINKAIENLNKNNIKNIEVIKEDANDWIVKNKEKIDIIIFDPPRSGLNLNTLESINKSNIKTIIYLSCDPKTLVRDLRELSKYDYLIKEVIPYDMFPQTYHVETLVMLRRQK
ncbi:23S rRNA (uracil(1939)-C(5))-methyltransferase RlmD [Metamycoplasma phocicerebrale]|uniref:23S rRNA (Uracil(1939)-C(5))-methyltransferase RlmD n=1 Tax=Metamycoplasma phocicerebrale TaxID=142649 RepID=A0A3T0TUG1_9BACT|nr:23S rRNA (uracil(1939)-C(5))-methyltransferase RlmD [Metamycoplasma phocicerebrale]AZZ65747.1 23S rRNA (uracil(1939)-C(5))-methyltransferase RlmD [Metamycoplasma phocicerebrale]